MDYIGELNRRIYYPTFEKLIKNRKTYQYLKLSNQSQWFSTERLVGNQLHNLNSLLCYAQKHSPFYKKILADRTSSNNQFQSLSQLSELPILDKSIIRANFQDLVCAPWRDSLWVKTTGGSTGEPLKFGYTKNSYEWRVAMSRRGYSWANAPVGSRQAYIWGIPLGNYSKLSQFKVKIHNFLDRQRFFNCFDFGEEKMGVCLKDLLIWKPDVLIGYTNALYEFALYVKAVGGAGKLKLKSVLCAAEKLHLYQRELIGEVFNCPVFNTYGSREFMLIASECEMQRGLHVSMENLIVEVVDDFGKPVLAGEPGRILITDLHNYGMPFIRYEIGDIGVLGTSPCPCGRGLVVLDDVVGRLLDVIRTPSGKVLPGEFFPHLVKDFDAIVRFQVVQKKIDLLLIRLQVSSEFSSKIQCALEDMIRPFVGQEMVIVFNIVDHIDLTVSGKYRVTISELDNLNV